MASIYFPKREGSEVPEEPRVKVREFDYEGMKFVSSESESWAIVEFYIPGRDTPIGMRRERKRFYGLPHVEELAKEMAIRVKPRFV